MPVQMNATIQSNTFKDGTVPGAVVLSSSTTTRSEQRSERSRSVVQARWPIRSRMD